MSTEYTFLNADIKIKFENKNDMETRINNFNKDIKEHNDATDNGEADYYIYASVVQDDSDKEKLVATIEFDDGESWSDVDSLVEYICKNFPNSNGFIGWSCAEESGGGYVRYANGGTIKIVNGKRIPSDYEQLVEIKKDVITLVEYIKDLIGSDADECGVKDILDKYSNGGK